MRDAFSRLSNIRDWMTQARPHARRAQERKLFIYPTRFEKKFVSIQDRWKHNIIIFMSPVTRRKKDWQRSFDSSSSRHRFLFIADRNS